MDRTCLGLTVGQLEVVDDCQTGVQAEEHRARRAARAAHPAQPGQPAPAQLRRIGGFQLGQLPPATPPPAATLRQIPMKSRRRLPPKATAWLRVLGSHAGILRQRRGVL